jgi:hypothetical protein
MYCRANRIAIHKACQQLLYPSGYNLQKKKKLLYVCVCVCVCIHIKQKEKSKKKTDKQASLIREPN